MNAFDHQSVAHQTTQEGSASLTNILLALDGSKRSQAAVPVARMLRDIYGARLHVVYVGPHANDREVTAERLGFTAQESLAIVFESSSGGKPSQWIARWGSTHPGSVVVMSTDTGEPTGGDHFGSVTESVFALRPERIVLFSPGDTAESWVLRRILLAHDGTPASHAATGPAADLAQRVGAEVIALHVAAHCVERPTQAGSIPAPRYLDQPQHEWPHWTGEFMNRLLAGGVPPPNVRFKLAVTGGHPGSEVARVAREREIDLVVMAWHGHWERESSATRVVVRGCGCPVMLVYSAD
jgi:nucleotide-binding universal stress UspA family protein